MNMKKYTMEPMMNTMENSIPTNQPSYLIFNNDGNWYINLLNEHELGPFNSYAEAKKSTDVLSALYELDSVA